MTTGRALELRGRGRSREADPGRELALDFQSGQDGAYEAIHDHYALRVDRICRKMLDNPHDAQEAAQETFLRVYQSLARFNGSYKLGAWIARIATNVCLDQLRARSRNPSDPVDPEAFSHDATPVGDGPEGLFLSAAEGLQVRAVVDSLPSLHRAAIVLRDFESLSYAEIAAALDLSETQVKALLHRARRGFKRAWFTTMMSALVPARFVQRFGQRVKALEAPAEHATQAAFTASPAVTSCGAALQQCGQFMSERVATVVTAVVVGTTAAAAGVATIHDAPRAAEAAPWEPAGAPSTDSPRPTGAAPRTTPSTLQRATTPIGARLPPDALTEEEAPLDPAPVDEEAPEIVEEAPVAEEPVPVETPAPEPTDPEAEPPPVEPEPSGEPEPPVQSRTPFMTAVGFNRGIGIPGVRPESHATALDCGSKRMEQRLLTIVSDGEKTYPASLFLQLDGELRIELTIRRDAGDIIYTGEADLRSTSVADGITDMSFLGGYRTANREAQDALGLPLSGSLSANFHLDCSSDSVISELLVFSTG
ncbi:MAG: sigma-70 family RNA polymerase sigma factor [Actinobacteria bacterium]|nr:sigma-70 family RNA polymerase sigma factor [Actinomycetota bacterium]